jgi:hypothetical protein
MTAENSTKLADKARRRTKKDVSGVRTEPIDPAGAQPAADRGVNKKKLQIRVPAHVDEEWRAAAQAEGISLNQFLENAIRQRRFVFEQATAVGNTLSVDSFLETAIKRHRYVEEEKHKGASFYKRMPQDEQGVPIFET